MTEEQKKVLKDIRKKSQEQISQKRKEKTYKGNFYEINSILGNDWARYFLLLGGREAGKSYAAMNWAITRKLKLQDQCKFYWLRLTEAATNNLLKGGADKFVDPDLKRKYNLHLTTLGTTVYMYDEEITTRKKKDGTTTEVKKKKNMRPFVDILSCSTFYNTKGVGYFDNEYQGEYILILDEMNRESSEANRFDIVYAFVNLMENLVRSTKTKIRVIMIGNTLDEASDILTAFNFIPDGFGRFKLKSKHAVIDNILPNEKYKERRKDTIADNLMPDASTFTNEIQIDRSLLVNKRLCKKPDYIIMFNRNPSSWFTVWNGNIIKPYNKEEKPKWAMRKYLDEQFMPTLQKTVCDMFDARAYKFTNLSTFKKFQKELKLLKPQK